MLLVFVFFCCLVGVFGDEMKSVSVMEGDSVTLHTNTKLQTDDVIQWMFGPEETLIARINKPANKTSIYADVLDGRFRDRLQANNQTGDLTITNITTQQTGLYNITITGKKKTSYRFNVTVYGLSSGHKVVICCAAVGSLMIVTSVVIFWIYRKHKNTEATVQSCGEEITYTDPSFCKRQTHKPIAPVEDEVVYAGFNKRP
ncbi:uncharacterized protein [Paramisgurnus dabryanus]|uniref:uncharacterized protein isoform X2 n=1 Tax=Paramisgurnus dabryanus TaxID=90735 RepID=UPI0031F47840